VQHVTQNPERACCQPCLRAGGYAKHAFASAVQVISRYHPFAPLYLRFSCCMTGNMSEQLRWYRDRSRLVA
jgi:hypothetical protein